ncbi:hypothetical protein KCP76_09670 [Salmonella enterica subsp. enterica serovar Weltevreden]|nr:hypothetical protein KCP76_09670 [Salmonella enterica subsp. enterica serovar Weltevreden]
MRAAAFRTRCGASRRRFRYLFCIHRHRESQRRVKSKVARGFTNFNRLGGKVTTASRHLRQRLPRCRYVESMRMPSRTTRLHQTGS